MDVQTVFASALIICLILVIVITWTTYPYAKYIVLGRTDGEPKYLAVQNIEVIDSYGVRRDIIGVEGKGQLASGFANTTNASAAVTNGANMPAGEITFNGKNMGYFKDSGFTATTGSAIGPVVAAIPGNAVSNGYVIFSLGCPANIARINITAVDDETSRLNLQRVKVYLLNKDKNVIKGTEQIIPMASTIPQSIHHITFA